MRSLMRRLGGFPRRPATPASLARPPGPAPLSAFRVAGVCARDLLRLRLGRTGPSYRRLPVSRLAVAAVALSAEHVCGPRRVRCRPDEVVAVCALRDAEETLPTLLEHHLALGVGHVVLLDNGSRDRTVEIARAHENVTLLRSRLPYRTYARNFRAYLQQRFCREGWCLQLDADELFDYPHSERVDLASLLGYLNQRSYDAVLANLLEMFADRPLGRGTPRAGDLRHEYAYYDLENIDRRSPPEQYELSNPELREYHGGIRSTAFGSASDLLHKYPLVRFGRGLGPLDAHPHRLGGAPRIADFSGILYHYQFTESLLERSRRAIDEESYGHASRKYRRFHEVLTQEPDLNLHEKAVRPTEWKHTAELLGNGFLQISDDYRAFAEARRG